MRAPTKILVCGVALLLGCGCHHAATKADPKAPPPADPPPADDPAIRLVTSAVMIDACPDSKKLDTKMANREIDELVGPCKTVPGGAAHFAAILLPGGRVELASPTGDPNEGVVPTCLLQKQTQLHHKLKLASACKFDVKLEQRGPI